MKMAGTPHATRAVLEEITRGEGMTLAQAAKRVPGSAVLGTHAQTVVRWAAGLPHGGGVLRLEAARVGCKLLTSAGALGRFLAALNGLDPSEVPHVG